MVAAYLVVIKAGGIAVGTMPLLRASELRKILAKAEISHALCDLRLLTGDVRLFDDVFTRAHRGEDTRAGRLVDVLLTLVEMRRPVFSSTTSGHHSLRS